MAEIKVFEPLSEVAAKMIADVWRELEPQFPKNKIRADVEGMWLELVLDKVPSSETKSLLARIASFFYPEKPVVLVRSPFKYPLSFCYELEVADPRALQPAIGAAVRYQKYSGAMVRVFKAYT